MDDLYGVWIISQAVKKNGRQGLEELKNIILKCNRGGIMKMIGFK